MTIEVLLPPWASIREHPVGDRDDQELRRLWGGETFNVAVLEEIIRRPCDHPGYVLTERYNLPTREALNWLADHLNTTTIAIRACGNARVQIISEKDSVKKVVFIMDLLEPYAAGSLFNGPISTSAPSNRCL
jgi:hypothetical protein